MPESAATTAEAILGKVVAALAGGGEARPGQVTMTGAVASAFARRRHLVVQAGTGTGKSLAYLVPAVLSGRRTVVATATKALQDQLAGVDLPFLAGQLDVPFSWAVLKGRSNYVCLQRIREQTEARLVTAPRSAEVDRLIAWAGTTSSGERDELEWEPSAPAWGEVSVSAEECPGASRCPSGEACFAELARRRAASADVVVVNLHLLGTHLAAGGAVLPEHDQVVIDEAHRLEDVVSDTAGRQLGAGSFEALARVLRGVLAEPAAAGQPTLVDDVAGAGTRLVGVLAGQARTRLRTPLPAEITEVLALARNRVARAVDALRRVPAEAPADALVRQARALGAATSLLDTLDAAAAPSDGTVVWIDGPQHAPHLALAPLDVAPLLTDVLWSRATVVLTSATIAPGMTATVGLDTAAQPCDELDVGSPFDYARQALLYCALHMPDPRQPSYPAALHEELAALIEAAGGRTLALFTSWRAMQDAAAALAPRLPYRLLTQAELPKPALLEAFRTDETSCLFATMGFWQGVNVPGPALSLVVIDRIPFPRPDEPLLAARRERLGAAAFNQIDLPRAATLLAQAAGRLVRSESDRGVVAVLDRRLGTASYRWPLVHALPPMRRTRHRAEAEAFLRDVVRQ